MSGRFRSIAQGCLRNCLAIAILRIIHTHHATALGSADRALVPLSRGTGGTQNAVATRHHYTRALFIKAHDAETQVVVAPLVRMDISPLPKVKVKSGEETDSISLSKGGEEREMRKR